MTAKCRFMYENVWDEGTVTASSENSNFPCENTQHPWPTRVWRSTSCLGTEWLKLELSDTPDVDVVIVWNHNLAEEGPGGGSIILEGNNTDDWATPAFTAIVDICGKYAVVFLPSTENYSWWRITFQDALNADGFLAAGRVFLGSYFEPVRQYKRGGSFPRVDPSPAHFSEGHQLSSVVRDKYNQYQYQFKDSYEKDDFDEIFETVGNVHDLFFCETPATPCGATLYVRVADWGWSPGVLTYWNLDLTLEDYL